MTALASPIDAARWGEHRPAAVTPAAFTAHVSTPDVGRYHLYGSHACPASHRLAITRQLAGLERIVSMSYVDDLRDARGWAFREPSGPDPVNGFTLLAEAYLATDPDYGGPVSVPVLWDRRTSRIASNSADTIAIDFATAYRCVALGGVDVRPSGLITDIEAMSRRIAAEVETHLGCAVYRDAAADALHDALTGFDDLLGRRRFLVGDQLTDADIRLWVQLVRYDAGPNAHRAVGPRLDSFTHLWRWARSLYRRPAFGSTTDFARFAAPSADLPPWPDTTNSRADDAA